MTTEMKEQLIKKHNDHRENAEFFASIGDFELAKMHKTYMRNIAKKLGVKK